MKNKFYTFSLLILLAGSSLFAEQQEATSAPISRVQQIKSLVLNTPAEIKKRMPRSYDELKESVKSKAQAFRKKFLAKSFLQSATWHAITKGPYLLAGMSMNDAFFEYQHGSHALISTVGRANEAYTKYKASDLSFFHEKYNGALRAVGQKAYDIGLIEPETKKSLKHLEAKAFDKNSVKILYQKSDEQSEACAQGEKYISMPTEFQQNEDKEPSPLIQNAGLSKPANQEELDFMTARELYHLENRTMFKQSLALMAVPFISDLVCKSADKLVSYAVDKLIEKKKFERKNRTYKYLRSFKRGFHDFTERKLVRLLVSYYLFGWHTHASSYAADAKAAKTVGAKDGQAYYQRLADDLERRDEEVSKGIHNVVYYPAKPLYDSCLYPKNANFHLISLVQKITMPWHVSNAARAKNLEKYTK